MSVFKRDEPDLPDKLDTADPAPIFSSDDLIEIREAHIENFDQPNRTVHSLQIDGSLVERVHLAGSQFSSVVCKDARLIGCDLANLRAHRISLLRVELIDCRLMGLSSAALEWREVLIRNSDLRFAQLESAKFHSCEFDACNCEEAGFQNADLAGSVLRSCKLSKADFRGAKLKNTDFRKSDIEEMIVDVSDLPGAIVDAPQAMVLARLMGIQIR